MGMFWERACYAYYFHIAGQAPLPISAGMVLYSSKLRQYHLVQTVVGEFLCQFLQQYAGTIEIFLAQGRDRQQQTRIRQQVMALFGGNAQTFYPLVLIGLCSTDAQQPTYRGGFEAREGLSYPPQAGVMIPGIVPVGDDVDPFQGDQPFSIIPSSSGRNSSILSTLLKASLRNRERCRQCKSSYPPIESGRGIFQVDFLKATHYPLLWRWSSPLRRCK